MLYFSAIYLSHVLYIMVSLLYTCIQARLGIEKRFMKKSNKSLKLMGNKYYIYRKVYIIHILTFRMCANKYY